MSAFDKTFARITRNKDLKDSGGFNSIPFGIPKLDRHVPGIMRGTQYEITASSGVGKTQLTKFLFVNQPYKFIKTNPHLGIKLKIFYFALEESVTEFMSTLICNRLYEEYGKSISPLELNSMGEYHLTNETYHQVLQCREYFRELEQCIEIIDYISNPSGIFKHVRAYARANGRFTFKGEEVNPEVSMFDTYIANNPNEYVIVINDHISLLELERIEECSTLQKAMSHFSTTYCRKQLTKHYGYAVVNVHQQAADKERLEFTNTGQSIETKLEPSLDGLGDCKLTQRDALVILGLFAPNRYEIAKHLDYDIATLKDNYRCLKILKNRVGLPSLRMGLFFNGATNTFKQMPEVGTEDLGRLYNNLKQGIKDF